MSLVLNGQGIQAQRRLVNNQGGIGDQGTNNHDLCFMPLERNGSNQSQHLCQAEELEQGLGPLHRLPGPGRSPGLSVQMPRRSELLGNRCLRHMKLAGCEGLMVFLQAEAIRVTIDLGLGNSPRWS